MKKYWIVRRTKTGFTIIDNPKHGFHKNIKDAVARRNQIFDTGGEWHTIIEEKQS